MKRTYYLVFALLFLVVLSCQDNLGDNEQKNDEAQTEIVLEEVLQSVLVDDILKSVDTYSGFGEGMLKSALILDESCPIVTVKKTEEDQNWPRRITIDYGEGCLHKEKMKFGKITIDKTGPWKTPGSVRKVKFKDYVVGEGEDAVAFAGHKRIENITGENGTPTFTIEVNIELTSIKGDVVKVIKRKAIKTQVWEHGFADPEKENIYTILGEARIVITKGEMEKVIEKNLYNIQRVQGCRFPQNGSTDFKVKTFDGKKLEFSLDYSHTSDTGSGGVNCSGEDCDCIAMLWIGNDSKELDLSDKWWKEVRK
jgi:hypothetical protein